MSIVLFNPDSSGHHSEFISHLVDFLVENNHSKTYHFVVSSDFRLQFKSIVQKAEHLESITWHFLQKKEMQSLENLNMISKSFAEYNLMSKYAKALHAKTVHLLYFNVYQLAMMLKRPPFKIHGILYQQFTRMPKDGLKNRLRYYRKWFITWAYSLNPVIERIFVLNDPKSVGVLNKKFRTSIFSYLPDPVPILQPLQNFDIYSHYKIPIHKKIILHFGTLANRKGSVEVVDALDYLTKEYKMAVSVLMVGRFENEHIKKIIKQKINSHSNKNSSLIIMDNQFVSNALMKSLFNQCFAVLIPNKYPEASSGILGHAIASQKPVITNGAGLLKELIENNGFGLLLDGITPKQIAKGLMEITSKPYYHQGHENYMANHTPNEFAQTILD